MMREPRASGRRGDWPGVTVYSLAFLSLISIFNYLDRSLLGLALPLIKSELQVSDTALGLVSGLAFVLFYTVLGFSFWSVMTMLTGLCGSIWQLAVEWFLMGAGEACGIASSNSMIADLFRRARRPLALSLFGLANSVSFIVLLLTAAGLLGRVAGPALVGMPNDHLAPAYGAVAIRYSLLIVAVTPVLAAVAFWRAAAYYAADIERVL